MSDIEDEGTEHTVSLNTTKIKKLEKKIEKFEEVWFCLFSMMK